MICRVLILKPDEMPSPPAIATTGSCLLLCALIDATTCAVEPNDTCLLRNIEAVAEVTLMAVSTLNT